MSLSPSVPRLLTVLSLAVMASAQEVAVVVPKAPTVLWHYQGATARWSPPEFGHGMVYVGGKQLVALNPESGRVLHAAPVEGPWGQPVLHGDVVLAHKDGGGVYAWVFTLDRQLWSAPTPNLRRVGGAICGDAYVVPSAEGVVALALDDGRELWRADLGGSVVTPVANAERVFVATCDGVVVALRGRDGNEVWRFDTQAEVSTTPMLHGGELFVADRGRGDRTRSADRGKLTDEVGDMRGGALHAFDAGTGAHLWGRVFGATGCSTPHADGSYVWAGFGRAVARFDRRADGVMDTEHQIRTGANAFGSPTVLGPHMVFGNLDGHLYVHSVEDGALVWSFRPGEMTTRNGQRRNAQVGAFLWAEGRLFVTTSKGLYAIGDIPGADPVPAGFVLKHDG